MDEAAQAEEKALREERESKRQALTVCKTLLQLQSSA